MEHPTWFKQTEGQEDPAERGLERWGLWRYCRNKEMGLGCSREDAPAASSDLCTLGPSSKKMQFRCAKTSVSCG